MCCECRAIGRRGGLLRATSIVAQTVASFRPFPEFPTRGVKEPRRAKMQKVATQVDVN